MPVILIVSSQPALLLEFMKTLENNSGTKVEIMATAAEVYNAARHKDLLAVILDSEIEVSVGVEIVRQLMFINAMIHVAWASELAEEEFHESTEGLGILMKLSSQPDVTDARLLAARLRQIQGPSDIPPPPLKGSV